MLNLCCFEGRLHGDARWIAGQNGDFVAFKLSVSRGKNKDGEWNESLWLNCTASDKVATDKLVPYLGDGQYVSIVGKLNPIKTSTSKDGKEYHSIDISVREIHLIGGAGSESQPKAGEGKPKPGEALKEGSRMPETKSASDIAF